MSKIYAIISGKGGVGKTTTTINVGASFNKLGEDVIIVDGNLTTPNVGIHLGAPIVPIISADEIIIVTNAEMSAVTDALKTIKLAEEYNKFVKGVIITRYRGTKLEMSMTNIKYMLEVPILGIIPEDDCVKMSQIIKNAVVHTHPRSKAARHYLMTSKRILGEDIDVEYPTSGIFGGFFRVIGLK